MVSRTIRRAAAMLVALAAPAVIFATPLPASAATSGRLCETYGSYCLGSNTLQKDAVVTEKSLSGARYLTAVLQSGTFQNHRQYKLRFNGNTSLCVTGGLIVEVVIMQCSDPGALWAQDGSRWINVAVTKAIGQYDVYLAGRNNGSAYFLKYLGQGGFYYQFTWK